MDAEAINKVDEYVQAISEKLGVTSAQAYEVIKTQVITESIISIVGCIITLALAVGFIVFYLYVMITKEYEMDVENWGEKFYVHSLNWQARLKDSDAWFFISILGWAISVAAIIANALVIPDSIMVLLSPDYYVAQRIIEMIIGG